VRALWSLPKAAPALLRHFAAYGELVALDIARAQRELTVTLIAFGLAAFGLLFALLLACFGVIAYFWDTSYRVASIAWLAGGFLLVTLVAAGLGVRSLKRRSPFLADLRREWQEDRVILERILSPDEEPRR
jgi:uncharacterized membrane protein YqjE